MQRVWVCLLSLIVMTSALAQDSLLSDVSFGPVVVGENRIPLKKENFEVQVKQHSSLKVGAKLLEDSLQWVRVENALLSPRMKLAISVESKSDELSAVYLGKPITPQKIRNTSYFHFFVSLFSPRPIRLYKGDELIARIEVAAKKTQSPPLVDYSCAPYNLEVEGLADQFLSVGCNLIKSGSVGDEKSFLEVHWTSPNIELLNGEKPPFLTNLVSNYDSKVKVKKNDGAEETVKLKADVPYNVHRLKTAIGFGPYLMTSRHEGQTHKDALTSPLMFYAKYDLTHETSFRLFDAFFYQESIFNNFGLYFAYDVGKALDRRFIVTPLLGVQGITYKSEFTNDTFSEVIYPQGFEFVYKHAFGMKNHTLVYGMFLSPSSREDYKNLWVRFGKGMFWELNYLSWKKGSSYSKAWGLSVGLPFMSFF